MNSTNNALTVALVALFLFSPHASAADGAAAFPGDYAVTAATGGATWTETSALNHTLVAVHTPEPTALLIEAKNASGHTLVVAVQTIHDPTLDLAGVNGTAERARLAALQAASLASLASRDARAANKSAYQAVLTARDALAAASTPTDLSPLLSEVRALNGTAATPEDVFRAQLQAANAQAAAMNAESAAQTSLIIGIVQLVAVIAGFAALYWLRPGRQDAPAAIVTADATPTPASESPLE